MRFVRSDSPEVVRSIASAVSCAGRRRYTLGFLCTVNAFALLVAVTLSHVVSGWTALWLGVAVLLAPNAFLLWRESSRRMNWVVAGCAGRFYVRLYAWRARDCKDPMDPDVLTIEASEIASMSIRTLDVFIYGPEPRTVERLMIDPDQTAADCFSNQIRTLVGPDDPRGEMYLEYEDGRLMMNWTWCRPALQVFLQQVAREFPSVVIGPDERSELDLNGIWHGYREEPNAEQRRMLVQAKRLGFGRQLPKLLWLHRNIPYGLTRAYLAEIEREDATTQNGSAQASLTSCQTLSSLRNKASQVSACNVQGPKSRILKLVMSLGLTYVDVRAALSVSALTYASAGRAGLLLLLSGSLVYFGTYESIVTWIGPQRGAKARWLYVAVGTPSFLALGVIALILRLFFEHSEIESSAYPLRILLIVTTLFAVLKLARDLSRLLRVKRKTGVGGGRLHHAVGDETAGGNHGTVDAWSSTNAFERSLLVVSYIFDSALWTWLVIYYRYFAHSFLRQSSWVMASLWIYVAACWLVCAGIVFGAVQSAKEGCTGFSTSE